MSQHDMDLANASGAAFRADANLALVALAGNNSGATAPATTFAFQYWADTGNDILKQRNAANTGWISLFTMSTGAWLVADPTRAALAGSASQVFSVAPATASAHAMSQTAGDARYLNATVGQFRNLQASSTGLTANVSVSADEIVVESAGNLYQTLRAVALTIAGTSVGANALDSGTIAASTWYSLWVIWNGTTTAGLMSTSATAPTLPTGYTHKARVGWIRTDGTANKYPLSFKQYGKKVHYVVAAGSNITANPVIASASAGVAFWTAIGLSTFVPSTAMGAELSLYAQNVAGSWTYVAIAPSNAYATALNNTNVFPLSLGVTLAYGGSSGQLLLENTSTIYWGVNVSGGTPTASIACIGWEDTL